MKYPVTFRQAQRLVTRQMKNNFHLPSESVEIAKKIGVSVNRNGYCPDYSPKILAQLARLAQRHGANQSLLTSPEAPSSGESRPKNTDEVAPQSADPDDGDLHGGDGASGEVENGQSEGGDQQSNAAGAAADQATNDGSGSSSGSSGQSGQGARPTGTPFPHKTPTIDNTGQQPGHAASETGTATSEEPVNSQLRNGNGPRADGDPETDSQDGKSALPSPQTAGIVHKPDAGIDDPQGKAMAPKASDSSDTPADALTGRANQPAKVEDEWGNRPPKESGDDDTTSEKPHYRYRKSGGSGRVSIQAKHKSGGVTAKMKCDGITPGLVRQARQALARLLEGGETQSGPRWNWVEFSKRLKTGRSVYPARKEEEGRPTILVLADVSGSCAGFSDVSLMVAQAVARLGVSGSDVIVVSHSNGYPQEWQINTGKPEEVKVEWGTEALPWYQKALRQYNIEAVVALGDWDAEWLYRWLAEMSSVKKLVWLDNWSSSALPPTLRPDLFRKATKNQSVFWDTPWHFETPWSPRAKSKSTYVVGCSEALDFLRGLKLAIK